MNSNARDSTVALRSKLRIAGDCRDRTAACFLIDSTGELRDWTAHADVVIIGKSFLDTGGQNPCEAILAGKPVVFGPHMENFEPLASRLVAAKGCIRAQMKTDSLRQPSSRALDPETAAAMTRNASQILASHEGATRRILDLMGASASPLKMTQRGVCHFQNHSLECAS